MIYDILILIAIIYQHMISYENSEEIRKPDISELIYDRYR